MTVPEGKVRASMAIKKENDDWLRVEAAKRKISKGQLVDELIEANKKPLD